MPHQDSGLVELPRIAVEPLEAMSRVPVVRPGSVSRTPLVNRLRAAGSRPVVTVLAPAGYGKTTVLAQWAERDGRPFVWVSIDEDDDDPISLARRVASGLGDVQPVDPGAPTAPGSHSRSAAQALRRLIAAVAAAPDPFVLVLDNIHLLRSRRCVQMVAALAEHVPDGSALVLAGRNLPRLPIARMRAAGRLFEVGVDRARAEPPRDQPHDAQPRRGARGERAGRAGRPNRGVGRRRVSRRAIAEGRRSESRPSYAAFAATTDSWSTTSTSSTCLG